MKQELQEKLFAKYPKIFRQRSLPMTETCMCWGIDTGDGWYDLLDALCWRLQSMTDWNPNNERFPQIEASQVKEKFGSLRFYTSGSSDYQEGIIDFAEVISERTCEECGKKGEINGSGWLRCRCPEHTYEQ